VTQEFVCKQAVISFGVLLPAGLREAQPLFLLSGPKWLFAPPSDKREI